MANMYDAVATKIIRQQEAIIGPLAWSEASKVEGLQISNNTITMNGDGKVALENLVRRYEGLFGLASVEVCKEAVKEIATSISSKDLPAILQ